MRWFEPNLQKLLTEAGTNGLRISDIVRNICNMEPQLFGERHPYAETWKEIYWFLRRESKKPLSPYQYALDKKTGKVKRGHVTFNQGKVADEPQMKIEF